MTSSYHATVPVSQAQLQEYEKKAVSQERQILDYLDSHPELEFSCYDLENLHVLSRRTPHSSYIRTLANMRKKGLIKKVYTEISRYGRPANVYRRARA